MTDGTDPGGRPSSAAAQVAVGLASLVEAWLRDTATCAVVLLSLTVAATHAHGPALLLGAAAAVAAVTPTVRRRSPRHTWLVLLAATALDVAGWWWG